LPGNQTFLSNPVARLSNISSIEAITTVTISYSMPGIGGPLTPIVAGLPVTIPTGRWSAPIALPVAAAVQALQTKYETSALGSITLHVDISDTYDSNPNDNHGVNSSAIYLFGNGVVPNTPIQLNNFTTSPIAFNLEIIGPNTIGALLATERVVLPENTGDGETTLNIPVQPPGSRAEITVLAKDDDGNSIGGFTARLYFS
jgi:hypothetical protein